MSKIASFKNIKKTKFFICWSKVIRYLTFSLESETLWVRGLCKLHTSSMTVGKLINLFCVSKFSSVNGDNSGTCFIVEACVVMVISYNIPVYRVLGPQQMLSKCCMLIPLPLLLLLLLLGYFPLLFFSLLFENFYRLFKFLKYIKIL